MNTESYAEQLAINGYCVVDNILDASILGELRGRFSDDSLADTSSDNFGDSGVFVAPDYHDRTLVKLLTWPKTLAVLADMGFFHPKLHSFYVSAKQPGSNALPWHSDLFYHYNRQEPSELFLIYYLGDTSQDNGCLRVVPGSHIWPHEERQQQPQDSKDRTDEIDVPVKAGQLFIGDRRILHATHPNYSAEWRTCLTIAYGPKFDDLGESIKELIVSNQCLPPRGWWQKSELTVDPTLIPLLPIY